MSQLGERFSNRNEARKRRAEMQDRLEAQKRATGVGRAQGVKQVQGAQKVAADRHVAVRQVDQIPSKDDAKRSCVATDHKTESPIVKPRHPLAQSDVNHMTSTANPARETLSVGPSKHQNPEHTIVHKLPSNHLAQAIAVHQARTGSTHAPMAPNIDKVLQAKQPVYTVHQSATSHTIKTTSIPIQKPSLAQAVQPVVVSEAENETGPHQNSDTSFESLTDMDGLFDAGGEEVEALFRACDGF